MELLLASRQFVFLGDEIQETSSQEWMLIANGADLITEGKVTMAMGIMQVLFMWHQMAMGTSSSQLVELLDFAD